jgi:hypothetical protein
MIKNILLFIIMVEKGYLNCGRRKPVSDRIKPIRFSPPEMTSES